MDDRKKLEHQIALATRTAAYTRDENTASGYVGLRTSSGASCLPRLRGAPRSRRAPMSCGSRLGARRGATWTSGSKRRES